MEAIKIQHSEVIVCDSEMYGLEPPKEKRSEFESYTENVRKVIVAGESSGKSSLYRGEVVQLDPYNLRAWMHSL